MEPRSPVAPALQENPLLLRSQGSPGVCLWSWKVLELEGGRCPSSNSVHVRNDAERRF